MPKFIDQCDHGKENFIGTIWVVEKNKAGELEQNPYDVHIFEDATFGTEVCIRYGNEPQDYFSPGQITNLIGRNVPVYEKAWRLIQAKGRLTYQRKVDAVKSIDCDLCENSITKNIAECKNCNGENYK